VLLVGGYRVLEGSLGIGVLTAAILYARRFFDPMEEIAIFYNSYQSAASALEKISGVLEEEPTVPEALDPAKFENANGQVHFDGVEFQYSTGPVVLHKFDLEIPAGQTIALVGTTGAGKSTLAKLISRFYDPTKGTVSIDGVDVRDIGNTDLRREVVMVTQEAYLFSGTVAENIQLGRPGASIEDVMEAAKAVGAHEFILSLPEGYDTDVNKRGGRVSAGQRHLARHSLRAHGSTRTKDIACGQDRGDHRAPTLHSLDCRQGSGHGARQGNRGWCTEAARSRQREICKALQGLERLSGLVLLLFSNKCNRAHWRQCRFEDSPDDFVSLTVD